MVLETWAVKTKDITANVYVDRKNQQFQKNFKCRREKGHLEERYPAFFGKVLFPGCNFHIDYILSPSAVHVSSTDARVLNRKHHRSPPQCPELTREWFVVRCALVTSVCGLIQWHLVLSPLNYMTINGWGSQIWLHTPLPSQHPQDPTRRLTGSHPHALSAAGLLHLPMLVPGSFFPWSTSVLPFQVSACMSFFPRGHLCNFCTPNCTFTISRIWLSFYSCSYSPIHNTSRYLLQRPLQW